MSRKHEYAARLTWTGNLGTGTATYTGYGRDYTVAISGKPDLRGTADPMFRGSPELHNPEDLFLTAISSCHMLSYLALCARHKISVVSYEDDAKATLLLSPDGGGRFEIVTLHPVVTITEAANEALAMSLHEKAHELCFIASSASVPIHHEAVINVESR